MKCSHCGSPLVVEAATAFADCEYCGKSTRVRGAKTLIAEQAHKPVSKPSPPRRMQSYSSTSYPTNRGASKSPITLGGCLVIVAVIFGLSSAILPLILSSGFDFASLPFLPNSQPDAPLFVLANAEPHTLPGIADGNEAATSVAHSDCDGYLHDGPDLRIQTPSAGVVHLDVTGAGDLTLAVHLSDGRWLCDDDSGGGLLPRIVEPFPVGEHQVYVGRYSDTAPEGFVLTVSEDMPSLPRPEQSLEAKSEEESRPHRRRRRRSSSMRHRAPHMSEVPPADMAPPPVIGAIPVAPQVPQPSENATRGMLSVNTTPWSTVRINGRIVGNTPRTNLIVPVGTVLVEVQREGNGAWERLSVVVRAGHPARLNHRF
ncbi:MAG: hypothetical protein ACI9KE_006467 [Polyangiales bacterium]|jgi:hypothetical protein